MTDKKYDVFGVGNALVDILAQVPDEFVAEFDLHKGQMALMDSEQQTGVLNQLDQSSLQLASGGSAANTMVAVAQSGGTGVYMGRVAEDPHGEFYKKDMENAGIAFPVSLAP
ncbi:MAG: PfkB family carbohydrate kinase, partial [Planctomycetota bacterium]